MMTLPRENRASAEHAAREARATVATVASDSRERTISEVPIKAGFDYASLTSSVAAEARASAERIRKLGGQQIEAIVAIGYELLKVKQRLGHGRFLPWLHAEFGMSAATAERYMAVAERLGDKIRTVRNLNPSTLFKLAARSTPQVLRNEIVARLEKGELISDAEIRDRIAESKRSKQAIAAMQTERAAPGPNVEDLADPLITIKREWRKLTKPQRIDFLAWAQTNQLCQEERQPNAESLDQDAKPPRRRVVCSLARGCRYTSCSEAGDCLHGRSLAGQNSITGDDHLPGDNRKQPSA